MALLKTFRCDATSVGKILDRVRSLGAVIEGDEASGKLVGETFLGRFEGAYSFDGTHLTLEVTSSPAAIPEAVLASQLDDVARKFGTEEEDRGQEEIY